MISSSFCMFDWRHGRPEPGNGRILEVALQPVTPQGDGHSVAASPPKAVECREWRPALRDKHELGCLGFPLQLPKGTQLKTGQLRCRRAPLDSSDVQDNPAERARNRRRGDRVNPKRPPGPGTVICRNCSLAAAVLQSHQVHSRLRNDSTTTPSSRSKPRSLSAQGSPRCFG
jgi:hypothetical protein